MYADEIIKNEAGNFTIKDSIFKENQGINISLGNSHSFIESCLFMKCSKDHGSAICVNGANNEVKASKICGRSCFLTKAGMYGIFYQFYGYQIIELLSYYDYIDSNKG